MDANVTEWTVYSGGAACFKKTVHAATEEEAIKQATEKEGGWVCADYNAQATWAVPAIIKP